MVERKTLQTVNSIVNRMKLPFLLVSEQRNINIKLHKYIQLCNLISVTTEIEVKIFADDLQ